MLVSLSESFLLSNKWVNLLYHNQRQMYADVPVQIVLWLLQPLGCSE